MPICLLCGEDRLPACAARVPNTFHVGTVEDTKITRLPLETILACKDLEVSERPLTDEIRAALPDLAALAQKGQELLRQAFSQMES